MIEEIEIDGFKLLNGFKADLKPLTVIIGANATGKSSLIECLQRIRWCCGLPLRTALGSFPQSILTFDGSTSDLRWKLVLHKPSSDYWKDFPIENCNLIYEVGFQFDRTGRAIPTNETLLETISQSNRSVSKIYLQSTPSQQQIFDRKSGKLISFDEKDSKKISYVKEAEVAEHTSESFIADSQSTQQEDALLLSKMQFANEFPVPSAARTLISRMSLYPGFDVTYSSKLRTEAFNLSAATWLTPNGDNLGSVLHELLTRYEFTQAACDLRDYLKTAFPTFEDIRVETAANTKPQLLVRVREKHATRSTEIWEISDGMLRFLCLAAVLLDPYPPPLIALDEPEEGLHPGLMPVVASMIKEASERTQVLITTHSPELLDCFDIENVAVMARSESELKAIWHRPSDRKHLSRLLQGIAGATLGELHRSGELEAGA